MTGAPNVMQAPCCSFGPRRGTVQPELMVLHYTAMQTAEAALERLCDPAVEVSAHYLISETGTIWQMVDEDMRAWHAGAGTWKGIGDVNSRSIGIELANSGTHPFPAPQMQALEGLMRGAMIRWTIPASGVIGHSDMAPDRKIDPGPRFDWRRLALQGLSVWPDVGGPALVDTIRFRETACRFGFPDVEDAILLAAVRLRFRPWGQGPLSSSDMAVALALERI